MAPFLPVNTACTSVYRACTINFHSNFSNKRFCDIIGKVALWKTCALVQCQKYNYRRQAEKNFIKTR